MATVLIILAVVIAVLAVSFLALVWSMLRTWKSIAAWLPTQYQDLRRINRLAHLQPGEVFYELGSGDARVCHYLARKNPHAKVIGIEMSWFFFLLSKWRQIFSGRENLSIVFADALKQDLSEADAVYFYAQPESVNDLLKVKLAKELKRGSRIISYDFPFDEWRGKSLQDQPAEGWPTERQVTIHVYQV